ncbi:hypothetical protein EVG20_g1415 [Dentipellis fragilis]|uniref:Peptidase S53 domain-containing protein n=1 Tax=Dentipellis fragilis TaxID=205917 RepID=A0A4Y9ZCQ0_9AGAM|nr:hypothetical protein EVG20_g1415 [Dentipellis fragilis]
MRVHQRRDAPPTGFVKTGAAADDQVIPISLAIKSQDFATLEKKLYAVSTPGQDEYGQHLTKDEVEELAAPSDESASAVKEWLMSHGLSPETVSPSGNMLRVNMSVKQANELLDADYATFKDTKSGRQTVRTLSYSVPASVQDHISFVHPTVQFPIYGSSSSQGLTKRQASKLVGRDVPASCADDFTPSCAQQFYGIPSTPIKDTSKHVGAIGVNDQFASEADLKLFLQKYRPDITSAPALNLIPVVGGVNNQSDPGLEGNFVTQWLAGLATGAPIDYISVGDQDDLFDALVDMTNALLNQTNPPQVIDVSYALPEPFIDEPTANHICQSLAQLGARGLSVIVGSGSRGVSGGEDEGECHVFNPEFPATCPYVTTIGGTTDIPETAWNISGGGFSMFFPIPSYQTADVATYQKTIPSSYTGLYNTTGRGFPDISAMASVSNFYWSGNLTVPEFMSGGIIITSSLIALLNDELASAGKAPLGFLNPLIYANKDAFTDVTSGSNPSCNTNGFSATTGWDAITGLGSPVYSKLRTAVGL